MVPGQLGVRRLTVREGVEGQHPRGLPIAGGSAGGTDQILAGLLAKAGGVDPKDQLHRLLRRRRVTGRPARRGRWLRASRGSGEYGEQVLGRGPRGPGQFRVKQRSNQVPDVPTIAEAGLDVGSCPTGAGLSDQPGRADDAQGRSAGPGHPDPRHPGLERCADQERGWDDLFLPGEEYAAFLAEEENRVRAILERDRPLAVAIRADEGRACQRGGRTAATDPSLGRDRADRGCSWSSGCT